MIHSGAENGLIITAINVGQVSDLPFHERQVGNLPHGYICCTIVTWRVFFVLKSHTRKVIWIA